MSNQISSVCLHTKRTANQIKPDLDSLCGRPCSQRRRDAVAEDAASLWPDKESVHVCCFQKPSEGKEEASAAAEAPGPEPRLSKGVPSTASVLWLRHARQQSDEWLSGSGASGAFWGRLLPGWRITNGVTAGSLSGHLFSVIKVGRALHSLIL